MTNEPPSIDGITQTDPTETMLQHRRVKAWKGRLLFLLFLLNLFYLGACGVVATTFMTDPKMIMESTQFVLLGLAGGAGLFVLLALAMLLHVAQSDAVGTSKLRAFIILILITTPSVLASAGVAFLLVRPPTITIDVVDLPPGQELIAPLQLHLSVSGSLAGLALLDFRPLTYQWDLNGDGKIEQVTHEPTVVTRFDQDGLYTVRVILEDAQKMTKSTSRQIFIQKAAFTLVPMPPIVDRPVQLSLASQYSDASTLVKVGWDFDADGTIDETSEKPTITHTFYGTGTTTVRAVADLKNATQQTFQRTFEVVRPAPLPFPVTVETSPTTLVGTNPFTVLFSVKTTTAIRDVRWDFGDETKAEEGTVRKLAHTFSKNGTFTVNVYVRSASGIVATLSPVVQVVEALQLSDLTFDGSPVVAGNNTIKGEAPLMLNLTPKTATPFVTFSWEAPEATEVSSTDTTLQAMYRETGTYTVTLLGRDANGKVLRKSLTITVLPPEPVVVFSMDPETGVAPLTVNFNASETSVPDDEVIGFTWNFGDGTPEITKGQTVTHIYEKPKTYNVTLKIQTVSGKTYQETRSLVVRAPPLQACFTRSREIIRKGDVVSFDASCTRGQPNSYLWDFGDSAQSDRALPTHTFETVGNITITLTVKDSLGNTNTLRLPLTILP